MERILAHAILAQVGYSGVTLLLQFNRRPVQGIDYLISNKLVDGNPASIAKYLKHTPGLDKVETPVCLLPISHK